jgi:hypothetical protein
MNTMTSHHAEQDYSVRFEVILQYAEFYPLRDAWLAEMAANAGARSHHEYRDGRERNVLRTEFRSATLVVTPHEWGVEYVVSFALGVASSVVANVIYDLLKGQVPHYAEMLMKITPSKPGDIRIDIKLDSPDGAVKIGVIERGRGSTSIGVPKLKKVIDEIHVEKGNRPKLRASKKRKKK